MRMDTEGRVIFFNTYAQNFFGFREEDIIGKNFIGTIVPERDIAGFDLATPVKINLIVNEALKLLKASLPATIKIRHDIKSDMSVLTDPTNIHQVLMNLCTNASFAMQEKGGVLEVRLSDTDLRGDFVKQHHLAFSCLSLRQRLTIKRTSLSCCLPETNAYFLSTMKISRPISANGCCSGWGIG